MQLKIYDFRMWVEENNELPSHAIWDGAQDAFHHSQMFTIVMRLEKCDSQVQFEHDASEMWERKTSPMSEIVCEKS